ATALDESVLPAQRISSMVASRAALRTALARLPEKYRAPLILRDLEQLPVAEVAARLDLPEGTVKAQLSRGRAKLEKILGALDWCSGSDGTRWATTRRGLLRHGAPRTRPASGRRGGAQGARGEPRPEPGHARALHRRGPCPAPRPQPACRGRPRHRRAARQPAVPGPRARGSRHPRSAGGVAAGTGMDRLAAGPPRRGQVARGGARRRAPRAARAPG